MAETVVFVGYRRYRLPFLDLIPFDEEQNERLGQSIRETGILEPIICWKQHKKSGEDVVVDGAHRVQWANKLELSSVPVKHVQFASEDEAREYCLTKNLHRRHLTPFDLQVARHARLERIKAAREAGMSQPAIAEQENISRAQVRKDIKDAQAGTPANVKGRDGKCYPARPEQMCDRCKRQGAQANCGKCAEMRVERKKKPPTPRVKPRPDGQLVDPRNVAVPDKLRTAYSDATLLDAQDLLVAVAEKLRGGRLGSALSKLAKHYPHLKLDAFLDRLSDVDHGLDELVEIVKRGRPWCVCVRCSGERCTNCLMGGLLPKWRADELLANGVEPCHRT